MKKILIFLCFLTTYFFVEASGNTTKLSLVCDTFILKTQEVLIGQVIEKKSGSYRIKKCQGEKFVRLKASDILEVLPAPKKQIYRIWIKYMNGNNEKTLGYISELGDSFIVINRRWRDTGIALSPQKIVVKNINLMKFKDHNAAMLGLGSSLAAPTLIGLIAGDDEYCDACDFDIAFSAVDKGIFAAIFLVPAATMACLIKIPISIKGDMEAYNSNKERLAKWGHEIKSD